jgi:hypothetical protein
MSILSAEMDQASDSGFEPFMILEDDIDVTPHFHDLNNHHYFISSRCRLLVFWIDQRRHGRFLENCTAVDAWDGDYDLNQQWTRL